MNGDPCQMAQALTTGSAVSAGMKLGHLILEPKDVEVLSKEEVKTYWITREMSGLYRPVVRCTSARCAVLCFCCALLSWVACPACPGGHQRCRAFRVSAEEIL